MRRYSRGERAGQAITRTLGGLEVLQKIKEHTAPLVWNEVVGEQVAQATEVIGVDQGVLRVSAKSAVWAHELTFYKTDILRRLNVRLGASAGKPIITEIHFVNRGLRRKPEVTVLLHPEADDLDAVELSVRERTLVEQSLKEIADENLRAALRRVRLADLRLRTWRLDHGWVPCPRCGELVAPLPTGQEGACPRCRVVRL